jgi:hypothetical protein
MQRSVYQARVETADTSREKESWRDEEMTQSAHIHDPGSQTDHTKWQCDEENYMQIAQRSCR